MAFDSTKHKNVLIKILKDIYSHQSLGPLLGFKGGTAAYLFYNLSRFSVDLDFDLLDSSQEDAVFSKVREILEQYGQIKDAKKKRFTLYFTLAYNEKVPNTQNIKVEINRRAFGSHYETKSYLGLPMNVMIQEDMAAHKLMAMSERIQKANRDIFDVWFFLQNEWPINKEIIKQRSGVAFKTFLKKCVALLEKKSNKNILSGMGELLDAKQKAWVKTKLKSETIFLLQLKLESEK